jgi:hypothetical protein
MFFETFPRHKRIWPDFSNRYTEILNGGHKKIRSAADLEVKFNLYFVGSSIKQLLEDSQ